MGNCCNGGSNDFDIINLQLDKDKKSNNSQDHKDQNTGRKNYNNNNKNNIPPNILLSKKKLKLIIRQSKSLEEGKEYIINSLGLMDPINIHRDGLTIFGDTNVSKKNIIIK